MNILLVDAPYRVKYKGYVIPYMGLAYLAAVLRDAGHQVAAFNGAIHDDPEKKFVERVTALRPDLVAFTAPTCKIVQAERLAALAKDTQPGVVTIIGGWHATAVPEETMQLFTAFDYLLAGEGENTIRQFTAALENDRGLTEVPGLAWRADGEVALNPPAPEPVDLTTLPWPAWDLFDVERSVPMYRHGHGKIDYPLLAKRGCPYRCLFCKDEQREPVRFRDMDDMFAEIHAAMDRWPMDGIQFFDETFTLSRTRTVALCERFLAEDLPSTLRWNAATRVDCIDADLLKLMNRAGCHVLQFGVESGNQQVLDANRKRTTLQQCRDAVRWCREAGIQPDMSFIFGLPYDNRHTVLDTARFSRELDPDFVAYFTYIPFPGTPAGNLARRGEANLRLLHQDYENYDQQLSLPCELNDVPARRLSWLRFSSYLRFFLRPHRWRSLNSMLDLRSVPRLMLHIATNLLAGKHR